MRRGRATPTGDDWIGMVYGGMVEYARRLFSYRTKGYKVVQERVQIPSQTRGLEEER